MNNFVALKKINKLACLRNGNLGTIISFRTFCCFELDFTQILVKRTIHKTAFDRDQKT